MNETGIPTSAREPLSGLFFCEVCRKPFSNESSRNRHLPYCRRTLSRQRTRVRSCRACSLAKTKCSFGTRCSRCTRKGLECVYGTSQRIHVHSSASSNSTPSPYINFDLSEEPVVNGDITGREFDSPDWSLAMDDTTLFNEAWNIQPITSSKASKLSTLAPDQDNEPFEPRTYKFSEGGNHMTGLRTNISFEQHQVSELERRDHISELSLPRDTPDYRNAYVLKPYLYLLHTAEAQYSAKYIIRNLRSYPQMMRRKATFPPFIHSHWYGALPAPLANCMGIAQMFTARTFETSPFVWRTIRMEQQRLASELFHASKDDLLAAIQAYMIYSIMRMDDETGFTDSDVQMLLSMNTMCLRFRELCATADPFSHCELFEADSSWEEWVFAESRRRVAILWFLISRVVCITTDVVCDTSELYHALPLPTSKSLWEANNRETWQSEYETNKTEPLNKMSFFGELIDAEQNAGQRSNTFKLKSWHANVDNLGTLLNLSIATVNTESQ